MKQIKKYIMNIPVGNYLSVACLSALLLATGGCEGGEVSSPPATNPVEVSLYTKALPEGSEGMTYRLLVFNKENDKCVKNISFVPGSSSVSLASGTYRFTALSVPEGLDLPAVDALNGVKPDLSVGFAANMVREFRISAPTEVEVGEPSTAYTATLSLATAVVSLNLSNLPADLKVAFKLSRMYTAVGLDGRTYSGETAYSLNLQGETVCFPCNGNVELTYTAGEGSPQTIRVGNLLAAGNRLSVNLAWSENARIFLLLSSTVTDWTPGNGNGEEGDAE